MKLTENQLAVLRSLNDGVSPAKAGRNFDPPVSRQRVHQICDRLRELGLVERVLVPASRNGKTKTAYRITAKGSSAIAPNVRSL